MDDEESLKQSVSMVDEDPRRPTPYELLLRQSRKMGQTATRTLDVTKEFLKQDVSTIYTPRSRRTAGQIADDKETDKLDQMVAQAKEVLAEAQTVILPQNLFPDTIRVDRTRVTITQRTFFWTEKVISLRIEDILNISCSVGPLFGSLTISSRVMNSTDHFEINYFWRKDALRIKHIIQGYIIAVHNNVETARMNKEELITKLSVLGDDPNI